MLALILHFEPRCGQTNILVYLGICSLMGSITVFTISLSRCTDILIQSCMDCQLPCITIPSIISGSCFFFFPGVIQVVSIKAIGIAIKLTLEGINQIAYPQTWFFLSVAVICVITQLNYLNRVSLMSSIVFLKCKSWYRLA